MAVISDAVTIQTPATPRKRGGRPSADQAGDVDRRILDAATSLFLRSGFDATSCDQVLALAGAGKASLYARYANKEALFSAVVRRFIEQLTPPAADLRSGMTVAERLRTAGFGVLRHALTDEAVGLMRACMATAQRLPELSHMAGRIGHDGGMVCVMRALCGPTPTPEQTAQALVVAQRFIDMVLVPQQMRALIGDDHECLESTASRRIDDAITLLGRAGLLDAFEAEPEM